jgi:hypothetical protein
MSMSLRTPPHASGLHIVLTGILLFGVTLPAGQFLSTCTNEVYIGICGESSVSFQESNWLTNRDPIRFDDKLAIFFYCRTGTVPVLVPTDHREFMRFKMTDSSGAPVPQTMEGSRWGARFDQFPEYRGTNIHSRTARCDATHPTAVDPLNLGTAPALPTPEALFEMNRPGNYYLTIEVNAMRQVGPAANWCWVPLKIPSVTVPVYKSASSKP